ncbi:Protein RRP6-like 2 [Dichanthelium oligosanthes]|uniref:Protein RRP6-like 2 n=1 Tax=Dichanthelium oligosanthes TaxID=888268 RepID=A0A1E5WNJ0_9POAL|nr:Protein RRP6-like 2 [Dichanthelium oligosanthes]
MDESEGVKGREEAGDPEEAGDGFQFVTHGKKKRAGGQEGGSGGSGPVLGAGSVRALTNEKGAAPGTKAKVPFHDPSIPRPQDVYKIIVDNYKPFEHVWLERSEDGTRPVHPLEKLPVEQFVDRNVPESEPVKPADLEETPFTLVEDHKGLMELAKKLKSVTEFAVDLEHNQYRSFQGLTCLMQISTRTEDFIVDTLKLRIYVGLYLQEPFKDPTKRKVMHGADRDIMWLQRDFHIYVCNLFDTGQASRVLQMERNSLEHLLLHFCGVTAKKEYQSADWRSRPLPDEMIKYAREDTHYLLYIYDLMKQRLQRESTSENDLLLEVHKRSNEICLQFYEKELLTDTSYLHIYGFECCFPRFLHLFYSAQKFFCVPIWLTEVYYDRLQEHELNAKQLAVVSALHEWRDRIARQEDESTGYVLPNKALIEIAKQMPTDTGHLKRIVKSKYPFVESRLDEIVYTIWNALEYSYAFEEIAEQLKKERLEQLAPKRVQASDETTLLDADSDKTNIDPADQSSVAPSSTVNVSVASGSRTGFMNETSLIDSIHLEDNPRTISSTKTLSGLTRPINKDVLSNNRYQQATQELKRPTLGALGNSASGRQTEIFGGFSKKQMFMNKVSCFMIRVVSIAGQFQGGSNVENFRSSVLPFQQFSGGVKHSAAIGTTESFYPNTGMHSDNVWIQSTQVNEEMQLGNSTYYPQLLGYNTEVVGSHYEPEGMHMSSYLSGFEPESMGTGLPPGRNKEGNFQNPMRRQSYPPSGNRYDRPYQ